MKEKDYYQTWTIIEIIPLENKDFKLKCKNDRTGEIDEFPSSDWYKSVESQEEAEAKIGDKIYFHYISPEEMNEINTL